VPRRKGVITVATLLGAITAFAILAAPTLGAPATARPHPFTGQPARPSTNRLDEIVFARLKELGLQPANVCTDPIFIRRAYLDVIGTIPRGTEAREFILSQNPNKRRELIDRLLERDEFADYWAMKWSDLLRVKAEFPINLWPNAAQAYHRWIRTSIAGNKPADRFARELLLASGSNFREPPVNFYRAMQNREPAGIAQSVALIFMGARTEKWPAAEQANFAAFFSQLSYKSTAEWKEEIVFFDPAKGTNAATSLTLPDGTRVTLRPGQDPRELFADWLVEPKNRWFARNLANRAWSWLLGRGVIHEPDDIRPDNPPVNAELLAYLESELVASRFDLKHLFRLILHSQVYQLASVPRTNTPEAAVNFAHYSLRRLEAEVLIDAINQVTGSNEKYTSAIPEPFTVIPAGSRSIALPDGSITSAFLELFGRPARDTGLESERNNGITAAQRLHLLNSSHILRKIEQSRLVEVQSQGRRPPNEIATALSLEILSRFPTRDELSAVAAHFRSADRTRDAVVDLAWALINSAEFLHRH